MVCMEQVQGIGPAKAKEFGSGIVQICSRHQHAGSSASGRQTFGFDRGVADAPAAKRQRGPALSAAPFWPPQIGAGAAFDLASASAMQMQRISAAAPSSGVAGEIRVSELSAEQQAAAVRALAGENLFITGAAGTGKSFLMRYVIQELKKSRGAEAVAVTAPTGIAAVNIGGSTIHSFSGIGLGRGDPMNILARVRKSQKAFGNWKQASVLVLDEISMLSSELFDLLDFIGKQMRGRDCPFGGLQLILCGDFLQLPPVSRAPEPYAFQAKSWPDAGLDAGTIILTEQHRQVNDSEFVSMLNELRRGLCTQRTIEALDLCHNQRKPLPTDGILPTKLYCTNRDVDQENDERLRQLRGDGVVFTAVDTYKGASRDSERTLNEMLSKKIAQRLELKVGAQVVLLRNLSPTLANGSRGVVVGLAAASPGALVRPTVRFDSGVSATLEPAEFFQGSGAGSLTRYQIPLKLGWALTVHRAQGMTLSRVEIHVDGAFACGQAYVALSRATGTKGLWLRSRLSPQDVKADSAVLRFYGEGQGSTSDTGASGSQYEYGRWSG